MLLGIAVQAGGAITNPAVQGLVSAAVPADRQGETQGALSSVQGLTAIVSPLVASTVFAHFTGPYALILLPGAPFVVSALAYCVSLWAVSGVRPAPALVRAEVGATLVAEPERGGRRLMDTRAPRHKAPALSTDCHFHIFGPFDTFPMSAGPDLHAARGTGAALSPGGRDHRHRADGGGAGEHLRHRTMR